MFGSLKGLSWIDRSSSHQATSAPAKAKVETPSTGFQASLSDGPIRSDGSDRFFGMENIVGIRPDLPVSSFGNTCYCNSILQCLYYSKPFREAVVNFPQRGQPGHQPKEPIMDESIAPGRALARINTEPLPTTSAAAQAAAKAKSAVSNPTPKDDGKKKSQPVVQPSPHLNENKDTPDFKKKRAMEVGPVLEIDQGNNAAYGMDETLFSALKDIFESMMAVGSRTGVVKPNRFLEILRRENDMFDGHQHQDAHEFLNYLLNEVIENVEAHKKKTRLVNGSAVTNTKSAGSLTPINDSSRASTSSTSVPSTGWIHELFEGLLSSETKCLTCENVSRRNEQFLDLSIDLEKNSSVTSCLRNFSASEMLCERNKFHCDTCGGLQEAEKRMKIKRLPRVLALHLKRFKYMESTNRFEKLHYRVLYPYHLRLFNTTDDAQDPDRLYELYAVVVHIGGGPYHGHYVAIVKTEEKGWLLFDDEMVEPVDRNYVMNFFGDRNQTGVASAYVLFYQETTYEAVQRENFAYAGESEIVNVPVADSVDETPKKVSNGANGSNGIHMNGHVVKPLDLTNGESLPVIQPSITSPLPLSEVAHDPRSPAAAAEHPIKSKKEREKEKKEGKEREKAEKAARKSSKAGLEKENGTSEHTTLNRFRTTSKSIRGSRWLGGSKDRGDKGPANTDGPADAEIVPPLPPTPQLPPTPSFPPVSLEEPKSTSSDLRRASKENVLFKRSKEEKKDKKDKKDEDSGVFGRRHHNHRPSIFGLRRKAVNNE